MAYGNESVFSSYIAAVPEYFLRYFYIMNIIYMKMKSVSFSTVLDFLQLYRL